MSMAADVQARAGLFSRLFGLLRTLLLGTLACMTPATSLIALGWFMRRMDFLARTRSGQSASRPTWILGEKGGGLLRRCLGGLAANIQSGLSAAFSLLLATLPFTAIWALSWWAGWENSFGKGYEQAFVGPALGLSGVVVFCAIMIWLPMAMAHQAVERRVLSLFEWRMVRSAVRHTGWAYVFLAALTVFFALPIFAGRGLITFAGANIPNFESMTPEQIENILLGLTFVKAGYIFVALLILRGWLARIYANAIARALDGPDRELWVHSPLANGTSGGRRGWALTHWMRTALLAVIWFGVAAQIYVGQFLNHDWFVWLTHPLIFLPFAI